MTIRINGENISYTLEEERTMGDVLSAIETECKKSSETIVMIQLDGKELQPDNLDSFLQKPINDDYVVDITTLSGTEIRGYMKELTGYILECAEQFETIPVSMQTGEDVKALELLERFLGYFNALYRCLMEFDITGFPIDIKIEEKTLEEYQKEITEVLQEITSSVEDNDIIQAGDLAEYELAPLVTLLVNGISSYLD